MKRRMIAAVAALSIISACGQAEEEQPTEATVSEPAPVPLAIRDPEAYKGNIGSAMNEIPESMRGELQRLLACKIQKDVQQGGQKPLNAEMIRTLTAELEANPQAAVDCIASN